MKFNRSTVFVIKLWSQCMSTFLVRNSNHGVIDTVDILIINMMSQLHHTHWTHWHHYIALQAITGTVIYNCLPLEPECLEFQDIDEWPLHSYWLIIMSRASRTPCFTVPNQESGVIHRVPLTNTNVMCTVRSGGWDLVNLPCDMLATMA